MLNLDTHILINAFAGKLTAHESKLLENSEWGISAIVLWEIAKLSQLKRIEFSLDRPDVIAVIEDMRVWPVDLRVCQALSRLDFKSDPADELIAATSIGYGIPLLTRDKRILESKVVPFAKLS